MRKGRLEEIEDEDDPSIDVSASQPSHVIYEKEEKIKIDYSSLNSSLKVTLFCSCSFSLSTIHFISRNVRKRMSEELKRDLKRPLVILWPPFTEFRSDSLY